MAKCPPKLGKLFSRFMQFAKHPNADSPNRPFEYDFGWKIAGSNNAAASTRVTMRMKILPVFGPLLYFIQDSAHCFA
jgi:hypothetical protein